MNSLIHKTTRQGASKGRNGFILASNPQVIFVGKPRQGFKGSVILTQSQESEKWMHNCSCALLDFSICVWLKTPAKGMVSPRVWWLSQHQFKKKSLIKTLLGWSSVKSTEWVPQCEGDTVIAFRIQMHSPDFQNPCVLLTRFRYRESMPNHNCNLLRSVKC